MIQHPLNWHARDAPASWEFPGMACQQNRANQLEPPEQSRSVGTDELKNQWDGDREEVIDGAGWLASDIGKEEGGSGVPREERSLQMAALATQGLTCRPLTTGTTSGRQSTLLAPLHPGLPGQQRWNRATKRGALTSKDRTHEASDGVTLPQHQLL